MKFNGIKKIILLGIILLIIAGITVVALKGINVYILLSQHESINLNVGKEVKLDEIKNICKEVFGNKEIVVRELELFDDSVNIISKSITDEEKTNLIQKVNEKYQTTLSADDITVQKVSNIRVRDLIRPYIEPVIISLVIIIAYIIIRFRKQNPLKLLGKVLGVIILTEAVIASVIAVSRFPFLPIVISLMSVIAILEMIIIINKEAKLFNKN